jgi:AraC-like DNA-binding protein
MIHEDKRRLTPHFEPTTPGNEYDGFHLYLPIAEEIFHRGLYVTSAGRAHIRPGQGYPPTQHPRLYQFRWAEGRILPEFSLILITAGRGVFESRETGKTTITEGSVILLFPGTWHRYAPDPKTGWTENWVQFNGELAHQLWNSGMISEKQPVIRLQRFAALERYFERLLARIYRNPGANSFLLSLHVLRFLTTVLESLPETPHEREDKVSLCDTADPIVAAAVDYIWTRSHTVLSVADVANHAGVSRRTLDRRMAAVLNHTVLEEIIRCRYSRAERLLRETRLPVKTVSSLAGFGSTENMRQVFIKMANTPPGNYRRSFAQSAEFRTGSGWSMLK